MSHFSIAPERLALHIGTQRAPVIVDVRSKEEFAAHPCLIPGSVRRNANSVEIWAPALAEKSVAVVCLDGNVSSQGVAARLRHQSIQARILEGGITRWRSRGNLLMRAAPIPPPDSSGGTAWVTRERPKIDRIACPWLIRRFVDPDAVFLFVETARVSEVADRFMATPVDVEGVFWNHRGDTCTFDTMLTEFGLKSEALDRLATIVRGADTARLDLSPEASGFLAFSLGLSRLFDDDLVQLQVGLTFYDAVYLWCRDASAETCATARCGLSPWGAELSANGASRAPNCASRRPSPRIPAAVRRQVSASGGGRPRSLRCRSQKAAAARVVITREPPITPTGGGYDVAKTSHGSHASRCRARLLRAFARVRPVAHGN